MLFALALSPAYSYKKNDQTRGTKTDAIASVKQGDELLFRKCLVMFKAAVKQKNLAQLSNMFNYPVQTLPQWNNEDLRNATISRTDGLMDRNELQKHFDAIFSKDAVELIPRSTDENLSEIDKTTPEDYYKRLSKIADKGSLLYELNIHYTQDNGKETEFGFVFGRVAGNYKILSYYSTWPLK